MPSSGTGKICRDCSSRAVDGTHYCAAHTNNTLAQAYRKEFDKNRAHDEHRLLYRCKRWETARAFVLRRDILCQECGHRAAKVVHHVIDAVIWLAQGGDFYDVTNLIGWCKPCHDSHTARTAGFAKGRV